MNRWLVLLAWMLLTLGAASCAPTSGSGGDDDDSAAGDDDDDDGPDYAVDPDVVTYVPEGYGATDPVRILFLGDSIAARVGASAQSLAYTRLLEENHDETWPEHADHDMESLYGALEVFDVSRGGATTDSLISEQLPNLSGQLGDSVAGETIVVFTIGGNDAQVALLQILTQGDSAAKAFINDVEANFNTILDYFDDEARFPDGTFVYFTNIYEPSDGVGQRDGCLLNLDYEDALEHLEAANGRLRDLAEDRGKAMVDLRGHFMGHGFYNDDTEHPAYHADDPTLWFDPDCIHPNDRGHHEIRRLYYNAIANRPLPLEPAPQ